VRTLCGSILMAVALLLPSEARADILIVGDSLTAGYGARHGFAERLLRTYPGQRLNFVGGRTAQVPLPLPAADVAIIELGTNDANPFTPTHLSSFGRSYRRIIESLRDANPRVRILCLGVWKQKPQAAGYDRVIRWLTRQYPRCAFLSLKALSRGAQRSADGWHPDDRSHVAIARKVRQRLGRWRRQRNAWHLMARKRRTCWHSVGTLQAKACHRPPCTTPILASKQPSRRSPETG